MYKAIKLVSYHTAVRKKNIRIFSQFSVCYWHYSFWVGFGVFLAFVYLFVFKSSSYLI